MEIHWSDLCTKFSKVADRKAFAKKLELGDLTELRTDMIFPPNAGQETMRKLLKALDYKIPDDEEVTITLHKNVMDD